MHYFSMTMPSEGEFVDHHPESASDFNSFVTYIYISSVINEFHHTFEIPFHAECVN